MTIVLRKPLPIRECEVYDLGSNHISCIKVPLTFIKVRRESEFEHLFEYFTYNEDMISIQ
jgi:hypothetical protein